MSLRIEDRFRRRERRHWNQTRWVRLIALNETLSAVSTMGGLFGLIRIPPIFGGVTCWWLFWIFQSFGVAAGILLFFRESLGITLSLICQAAQLIQLRTRFMTLAFVSWPLVGLHFYLAPGTVKNQGTPWLYVQLNVVALAIGTFLLWCRKRGAQRSQDLLPLSSDTPLQAAKPPELREDGEQHTE